MPTATLLYAGLLGLLSIALSAGAGILRGRKAIDAGDGGDPEMLQAMRRHANFVEYVPLALLLIALLEISGVRGAVVHGLGIGLVAGRLMHAGFFHQACSPWHAASVPVSRRWSWRLPRSGASPSS